MAGKLFKVEGNPSDIPMIETDYYKWLQSQNYTDINNITTKLDYLKTKGFVMFENRISYDDLKTLQYIEQTYWDLNLKPKKDETSTKRP